jgi:hypothetical protein
MRGRPMARACGRRPPLGDRQTRRVALGPGHRLPQPRRRHQWPIPTRRRGR